MPDENSQASEETRKLRARFPGWGILFDPRQSVWVAVHGKKTLVAASSPETLTERVEAAARTPRLGLLALIGPGFAARRCFHALG